MMRRSYLVICVVLLFAINLTAGDFEFSVKSGTGIQGANLGYKLSEKFSLYSGFDVIGLAADLNREETNENTYGHTDDLTTYKRIKKSEIEGSASLVIPRIGVKYKFSDKKLQPYVYTDICKSFAFVDMSDTYESWTWRNGVLTDYDKDKKEISTEQEAIENFLGFWGINLGFGTEYLITESLGVTGEFGFRMLFASSDTTENSEQGYDDGYYKSEYQDEWDTELGAAFKFTTTSVGIVFHF